MRAGDARQHLLCPCSVVFLRAFARDHPTAAALAPNALRYEAPAVRWLGARPMGSRLTLREPSNHNTKKHDDENP